MSFSEKIASLMARPGQDLVAKDDVPWWMKYGGRGLGTVGGFIAIFLGIWNCSFIIFANTGSFISGIWQMIAGFIVLICEAPCCCMFVDFVQTLSDWVDKRPYWNRAVAYVAMAIPAIIICPGLSTILGSGLIFTTGVLYGMMALGKKAPVDQMATAAMSVDASAPNNVTSNEQKNSMRSTLVDNALPMSFTGLPQFDSNV